MTLLALGLNHQTAPVNLREQVAFTREQSLAALATLTREPGVTEAAIISTCNRTELYCSVEPGAQESVRAFLHRHHELSAAALDEFLYRYEDEAAVRHLYRVATGLDSLVLGEPQILGQVKDAYHVAREAGALKAPLERLFQSSFAVAKRVRTDTRIGANPVSVAFAAVRLTQQVFADLRTSCVLLIGAGDTIELVARHVADAGVARMLVANRTLANAESLAQRHGAGAMPLGDLPRYLHEADVVISSTASRDPLVTQGMVATALRERRRKPMLFIDLAVPRDVEANVAELDDVYVYTVDDLGQVIEEGMRSRREAAREAEAIIDLSAEHFMAWLRALAGTGSLRSLRHQGESVRDRALSDAKAQIAAGRSPDDALQWLAHTLTNKLLHAPSANLRAAALRGDQELLRAAERLFKPTRDGSAADDRDAGAAGDHGVANPVAKGARDPQP